MIKIIIRNSERYKKLIHKPLIKDFLFYDISRLKDIEDRYTRFHIINQIRLVNGTYKTTLNDRFSEIDQYLIDTLEKNKLYVVHDVAVSDGITSLNLYTNFTQNGLDLSLTLSDKFSTLFYPKKKCIRHITDREGNVVYTDFLGIMLSRNLSNKYFLSRVLSCLTSKTISITKDNQEIFLINPEIQKLITYKKVTFEYFDLFGNESLKMKYNLIRCMNILTKKNFSDELLLKGISNLLHGLNNPSHLIVGRTELKSGMNFASIFYFDGASVEIIKTFNGGSEVDELIMQNLNEAGYSIING